MERYWKSYYGEKLTHKNMPDVENGVLIIPEDVQHIDCYSFKGCVGIKEIVFSVNLTHIDCQAFLPCKELEKIHFHNIKLVNVFGGISMSEKKSCCFDVAHINNYTVFLLDKISSIDETEIYSAVEFSHMSFSSVYVMEIFVEGKNGIYGSGFSQIEAHANLYWNLKNDKSREQYRHLAADTQFSWEEAVAMIRILLGEPPFDNDILIDYLSKNSFWSVKEIMDTVTKFDYDWNDWIADFLVNDGVSGGVSGGVDEGVKN